MQQVEAVQKGRPVRISAPEIGAECVLIRADVYEQVQGVFDDEETDVRTALPFVNLTMQEDDADDPLLESYQKYRREPS